MIRLIYILVVVGMLAFAVLVSGCATKPTPEQEHNEFMRFCDERVQNLDYVYEMSDKMFEGKGDEYFHEWSYAIGLYHGCVAGIMEWHWWRHDLDHAERYRKEMEEKAKKEKE